MDMHAKPESSPGNVAERLAPPDTVAALARWESTTQLNLCPKPLKGSNDSNLVDLGRIDDNRTQVGVDFRLNVNGGGNGGTQQFEGFLLFSHENV